MPLVSKNFSDIITFTRASSATFTGSNGLIQSATTNTPRFDYDPVTLAAKGLLIEEQRTNLLTYSEDFTNAAWTATRASITTNATTAPDGAATADKLVEDTTASNSHFVSRTASTTVVATTSYTATAFIKAGERTIVQFSTALGGTTFTIQVNLSSGSATLVAGSPTSFSATSVGNGWFRVAITGTSGGTTSGDVLVRLCDAAGNSTYTGDGTSGIFLWGAQLEAGSFATSYIPTVASQVTRSADVASVNTLSPWYNATEGTLYTEADTIPFNASLSGASFISELGDGSVNNVIGVRFDTGGTNTAGTMVTGGANQGTISGGAVSGVNKMAHAFSGATRSFVVNGGAINTGTYTSLPAVSLLSIGRNTASTNYVNGHIRRITYYPRRLSNAELVSITA